MAPIDPAEPSDGPQQSLAYFPGRQLRLLWHALGELGVSPASPSGGPAVWLHSPEHAAGLPCTARATLPGHPGIELELRPLASWSQASVSEGQIVLRLRCGPGQHEAARAWMGQLLEHFRIAQRMLCSSADSFLGLSGKVTWHSRSWPRYALIALHRALEAELAGWSLVQLGKPRNAELVREPIHDPDGKQVLAYTSARWFHRREESWLVIDLSSWAGQAEITLQLAVSGLAPDFPDGLLDRLDERVQKSGCLARRKMTAEGEELRFDRTYGWDDLFIEPAVLEDLRSEIDQFFSRRELYERMKLPHRRGLLLHGPPGTGKTLLGKVLACSVPDSTFIWITADHVSDAASVARLFRMARSGRRVILFFEDLDLYAGHRETQVMPGSLGELLVQLDGMHANDGILVVATTNDLEAIEPALRDRPSRFDRLFPFERPSEPVRRAHLQHLLEPFGVPADQIRRVTARTEGFTGAQLQELAFVARSRAMRQPDGQIGPAELDAATEEASRYKATVVGFGSRPRRRRFPREAEDLELM